MNCYPMAALEWTMRIQEVILRALAKKITWWQAAEIIGITDRQMRRWHWRYKEYGHHGLLDRRLDKPSPKRVPVAVIPTSQRAFGAGFGTWQGRLPQELRLRGISTLEQVNAFLEQEYTGERLTPSRAPLRAPKLAVLTASRPAR
jgi:hypothetical protein